MNYRLFLNNVQIGNFPTMESVIDQGMEIANSQLKYAKKPVNSVFSVNYKMKGNDLFITTEVINH